MSGCSVENIFRGEAEVSAFLRRTNRTSPIGVDLGSGNIKMAQFKQTPKGLALVNFGILPTPEDAIREGKVVNSKRIVEALKELLKFHSFVGQRIVVSVPGQLVIVKEILIEELPEDELREAIKWEMEKFFPFPIEKTTFDYKILNRVIPEDESPDKLNVMVVAAPLDVVHSIVDVMKEASLDPIAIEVEPFSKLRLLQFIPDFDFKSEILFVMLNIGHTYTSVSMIDKGMVNFFRTLPIGGKKFTDAIAQSLGKNFKVAQEIKETKLDLNKRKDPVTKAVLPLLDNLLLEVKRSINYYFKKFNDGKSIDTVILVEGGSANLKGINEYIEESTSFPASTDRLLADIAEVSPELFTKEYLLEMAPFFSVATGLALREHRAKPAIKAKKVREAQKQQKKPVFKYKKG